MTSNSVAIIRYQYDNHLGSASLELDENAEIISYEEYHPFGTTSYRSGRTETETSQKRYKYVGKERDEETGLYYYGFRYYAAWLCRFVSVDPLQFDYPQLTPFQYASNRPVTGIDLDGLEYASVDGNPLGPLSDNTAIKQKAILQSGFKTEFQYNYEQALFSRKQVFLTFEKAAFEWQLKNGKVPKTKQTELTQFNPVQKFIRDGQAMSPVSYGGNGFGLGLARDPFVQISAQTVFVMGGGIIADLALQATTSYCVNNDFSGIDFFDVLASRYTKGFSNVVLESAVDVNFDGIHLVGIGENAKPLDKFAIDFTINSITNGTSRKSNTITTKRLNNSLNKLDKTIQRYSYNNRRLLDGFAVSPSKMKYLKKQMNQDVNKVLKDEIIFDLNKSFSNDATLIINRTSSIIIHSNE